MTPAVSPPEPAASLDRFVVGCVNVLEFPAATLRGTGIAQVLHDFLLHLLGRQRFDDWIARLVEIPQAPPAKEAEMRRLLADPLYGPLTRGLMTAWYTGSWHRLPDKWHAAYGTCGTDADQVISSQAYQEALVWPLVGAHPPGAKQQGWAAWSRPPALMLLR